LTDPFKPRITDTNYVDGITGQYDGYHTKLKRYISSQITIYDDTHTHTSISSGTSLLNIYDEGVLVSSSVTDIDFRGSSILAQEENGRIVVYSPVPTAPSHYNTTDGFGISNPSYPATINYNIANPGTYQIGDWVAGTAHPSLSNGAVVISSVIDVVFDDDNTTIEVVVTDPTGIIASKTTPAITGNYNNTTSNINVVVSNWTSLDATRFTGSIVVTVDIDLILANSGRFNVKITHHSGADYSFIGSDIFYDNQTNPKALATVAIAENTKVIKSLSGVNYYNVGSTFDAGIADIDYINSDTYPTNFIEVDPFEYGMTGYFLTGAQLTGWTNSSTNVNSSYAATISIVNTQFRTISTTANIFARIIGWIPEAWIPSPNTSLLIDTYVSNSTGSNEEFTDENYRRLSNWNPWNSAALLTSTDLMIINGVLKRQYGNWTSYNPTNTAIYSSTSTQYYYRIFKHNNVSHSNGEFSIDGVTEADIANDAFKIEISLDGSNWYNCNEDYAGGVLNNGDGCRVASDTEVMPTLKFTFGAGKFTTVATAEGYGMYTRISMPNGSGVECSYIRIVDWV
jgi:hypothetical protein